MSSSSTSEDEHEIQDGVCVLDLTIHQILVEDLGKRKVASQFVLHALSDDQDTSVFSTQKTSLKLLIEIKIS